jgi:hypothetical protein
LAKANLIKPKSELAKNKNSLLRKLTGDFYFLNLYYFPAYGCPASPLLLK